ncbi:hypothetical protein D9758_006420 [Tetrapyrgos nigripes]|uniref:Putative gamma-glutamylcyclotransferase n=1 Tax=Tetrapyrgos nigripes TaxID=182062 RepID=A0A8H5G0I0_9AGAR|nr:hypothetical protein D9758_006420 [Tetrapyrgos nigripes]
MPNLNIDALAREDVLPKWDDLVETPNPNSFLPPHDKSAYRQTLFVYGTLSLQHVLQKVLGLAHLPTFHEASIRGYVLKMWGPYPAFVESEPFNPDVTVRGKAWVVQDDDQLVLLKLYEGDNYRLKEVEVLIEGRSTAEPGYTFVWNSYIDELTEGVFDPSKFPVSAEHR